MTTTTTTTGRGAGISDAVSRLLRMVARAKHDMAQRDPAMKDAAVMAVLANLVEDGPQRSATLACSLRLDPSQVSRHIATAVRDGLVERRIDAADGRAVQLVPTPEGERRFREFAEARARHLDEIVADWDRADLESFTRQLDRFVTSFERHTIRAIEQSSAAPALKRVS